MVIRVLTVPDYLDLASFDEVFCTVLGWNGLGFSFHIHGQELECSRNPVVKPLSLLQRSFVLVGGSAGTSAEIPHPVRH